MSITATADDIRENYDGVGDPEFVADRVGDITQQQSERQRTALDGEMVRETVEEADKSRDVTELMDEADEEIVEELTAQYTTGEISIEEFEERLESEAHVKPEHRPDYGTIDVAGERVGLEKPLQSELGTGHLMRLRVLNRENELSEESAESILAALNALAECTSKDSSFWYDLTDHEVGNALQQALIQSRGGGEAGK